MLWQKHEGYYLDSSIYPFLQGLSHCGQNDNGVGFTLGPGVLGLCSLQPPIIK